MVLLRLLRKSSKNQVLIYVLLTLIPSILISTVLTQHHVRLEERQYKGIAHEAAIFHARNIENLLSETAGRLEMLATSVKVQNNDLDDVEKILRETMGKDFRFSGFYWASPAGDLLISTNKTNNKINIGDRPYFQEALKTEKTSISEPHIGRVTGRFIISMATPIVDHGNIQGVLVASLRFDEIEAAINNLVKDEKIVVSDASGNILIKTGSIPEGAAIKSSRNVSQVPWTISAYVSSDKDFIFQKSFIQYLVIFITITNIIFLLVQYLLLRKKVEREKKQTEIHKLELIGNLAASTAHEIRNPLTGIKGLVKLLSEENKDKKAQAYFDVIQTEIDRINTIVSELLVLGKPTANHLKTYNANDILAEIVPIIHSETNFMNVEMTIHYAKEELPVSCVKDHLKQVILNLTKNSLQAMPYGGKLIISLARESGSCIIKVADNGVGMQKDQISQAFNPFYTLKKDGSGLGLTVCKRIIDTFGGQISIKSTPNEGTEVEIILPLAF